MEQVQKPPKTAQSNTLPGADMGSLTRLCCLAVVLVGATVARPSAEVLQRDARGQTVLDSSDPFWVFRSGEKPMVYIPNYDAVLVPAQDIQPHALPAFQALAGALPFQPPRRRRPILAVLDLLQKRYNLQAQNTENPNKLSNMGVKTGESEEDTTTTTTSILEEIKGGSQEKEEGTKPNSNTNSNGSKTDTSENSNNATGAIKSDFQSHNSVNIPQITRIYSLLDTVLKDHPDLNNGFSYAYKYRVPQTPTKLDGLELSVQQSLNRFPNIAARPLQHRVFKTPIDYKKAQAKLDSLLEESSKSEVPIHLNTPGAFGPLLLNKYLESVPEEKKVALPDSVVIETPEGRKTKPTTKLMLRPVAKAVAGPRGIAVASPIARAVVRKGQPVTLEFEPDAVAIAGPGGRAHAHPEFSIDYIESKESET